MDLVNVPSKITKGEDLVIIPKKEYEQLSALKKIYEFSPTTGQKKALKVARINRKKGNTLTLNELRRKLATRS